jgi:hypothetical protein
MAAAQDDLVVVADKATYEAAVQAAAQAYCPAYGQAAATSETYGTKVKSGDSDIGLPLSAFMPAGFPTQLFSWISYWDVNANGLWDNEDVPYLQFGSLNAGPGSRFVRENNIRLAGWGNYPPGSYVKQSDADMGQPLAVIPATMPAYPAGLPDSFYYLDVAGGSGYDLEDPVYLKVMSPPTPLEVGTNDIRITANAGFPAGSRVSLNDPDAGKPITLFKNIVGAGVGGPSIASLPTPIGFLMFYNANGNVQVATGFPIFDNGDVVYFHHGVVAPLVVSPNDIRLY